MSRAMACRMVKRVMERAGITGKQATVRSLRHAVGMKGENDGFNR